MVDVFPHSSYDNPAYVRKGKTKLTTKTLKRKNQRSYSIKRKKRKKTENNKQQNNRTTEQQKNLLCSLDSMQFQTIRARHPQGGGAEIRMPLHHHSTTHTHATDKHLWEHYVCRAKSEPLLQQNKVVQASNDVTTMAPIYHSPSPPHPMGWHVCASHYTDIFTLIAVQYIQAPY